jgi:hypothetical protein
LNVREFAVSEVAGLPAVPLHFALGPSPNDGPAFLVSLRMTRSPTHHVRRFGEIVFCPAMFSPLPYLRKHCGGYFGPRSARRLSL